MRIYTLEAFELSAHLSQLLTFWTSPFPSCLLSSIPFYFVPLYLLQHTRTRHLSFHFTFYPCTFIYTISL
jgi:hypothetical protein